MTVVVPDIRNRVDWAPAFAGEGSSSNDPALRIAAAALALVGTRFRLHGRDPATGLDCIGVACHALRAGGWGGEPPTGYALRGGDPARVAAWCDDCLAACDGDRPGDILLFAPGPGQLHVAVRVEAGIVHADASLRRVAVRPGVDWPVLGAWRI